MLIRLIIFAKRTSLTLLAEPEITVHSCLDKMSDQIQKCSEDVVRYYYNLCKFCTISLQMIKV